MEGGKALSLWLVSFLGYVVAVDGLLILNFLGEVRVVDSDRQTACHFPAAVGIIELAMGVREKEVTTGEHGLRSGQ